MRRKFLTFGALFTLMALIVFNSCTSGASAYYLGYGYYSTTDYTLQEGETIAFAEPLNFEIGWDGVVSESDYYNYLHFESSNENVASVNKYGTVTAKSEGSATISLRVDGCSTVLSWYITVYGAASKVTSISLDRSSVDLAPGNNTNVYITMSPYYAADTSYTVSSSDTAVATVTDYPGYISIAGIAEGSATVTVTSNSDSSVTATISVTVTFQPTYDVYSVTLNRSALSLDINETCTLIPTVSAYYTSTNKDVIWTSSNTSVATVSSSGVVTGIGAGSATITATSKDNPDKSASCSVTVSSNVLTVIESITITGSKTSIYKGEEVELTATVIPADADVELTWNQSGSGQVILTPSSDTKTCTVRGLSAGSVVITAYSESSGSVVGTYSLSVNVNPSASANQYFWGTWIRMDRGTEIIIDENSVKVSGELGTKDILSSTDDLLSVDYNGETVNFTRASDSVIETKKGEAVIPYFRKGGTNLSYSLKVVGFEDSLDSRSISRAAGTTGVGKSNLKVKGASKRFTSYEKEETTNADGEVTLTAPIQGDVQTVTIIVDETDSSKNVVIDNLKVENNNDFLGTVPIVEEGDYSLKITGVIDEADKTDGYLYSGNTYPLTLTIANISDIKSEFATAEIFPDDDSILELTCTEYELKGVDIPTMKAGTSIPINVSVRVKDFNAPYIDTRINVNVLNGNTDRTWVDYIPLRVYKTKTHFTFAATSPQHNTSSALNGFLIYPDGNSQYFSCPAEETKTIDAPLFKDSDEFVLVFSGATVNGDLSDSTELYYTVAIDSEVRKEFAHDGKTAVEKNAIKTFGEKQGPSKNIKNNTEDNACPVSNNFEAYLAEGDIDFYKICINSSKINSVVDGVAPLEDIEVTYVYNADTTQHVLTADASYDTYVWEVEGEVNSSTTNTLTIANADLLPGITEVTVLASKDDEVRSATIYVEKK